MDRLLDSDQLGKKGESRFPELCVDAGLIPNASTWDRKGWDFVVDWRHAETNAPYDQRPTTLSCLVQVKTIWKETRSIRLRLSSVEHIAKDIKPAFIYVFKINNNLSYQTAAIAHLEGGFLAHILKSLREATAAGTAPNNIEIDLSLTKWFKILEPTALALRSTMEEMIGGSMQAYAERKQRQLRELGYEQGRVTLKTTILAPDNDYIVDGLLGLKPLEIIETSAIETRFGIPLPLEGLNGLGAKIDFLPTHQDTCKILAREDETGRIFSFNGKMYIAPKIVMPENHVKILIKSELFSLILASKSLGDKTKTNLEVKLTMETNFGNARVGTRDWYELYAFLSSLDKNDLQFQIQPKKMKGDFSGRINLDPDPVNSANWQRGAKATNAAKIIFERAGWSGTKLSIKDINDSERELITLGALIEKPESLNSLTFSTDTEQQFIGVERIEILYFNCIRIGSHLIAYVAIANMIASIEAEKTHWRSFGLSIREVNRLKPAKGAYETYIETMRRRLGVNSYFAANTKCGAADEGGPQNQRRVYKRPNSGARGRS